MHFQPKCLSRKHKCTEICVSQNCVIRNPFICDKCQQSHPQSCIKMQYKEFVRQIHIILGLDKNSILQFEKQIQKFFQQLMDSLRDQFLKFRDLFETFNAPQQIKIFYNKINKGEEITLNGKYTSNILKLHKMKNYFERKGMIQMRALKNEIVQLNNKIRKNLQNYYAMNENKEENMQNFQQNKLGNIDKRFTKQRRDFVTLGLLKKCDRDIQTYIGKQIYNIQLAFRASQHQFQAQKFHMRCDGMKNTLILAETEYGKIVGAYCGVQWKSPSSWIYQEDINQSTFLFSLSPLLKGLKFTIKKKTFAIGMHKEYGPCFGDDFVIYNKANNSKSCWSNFPDVFQCRQQKISHNSKTIKEFIGVEDHFVKFNLKEWEVYKISFSKQEQIQRSFMEEYRNI